MPEINPSSPVTQTQTWAAIITTIAGAIGAVLAKKRFGRSKSAAANAKAVTHTEFQAGLDQMRDRVAAGYMALGQKMDSGQKEILSAITAQGTAVEKRLDALESAVARLDERTKNS